MIEIRTNFKPVHTAGDCVSVSVGRPVRGQFCKIECDAKVTFFDCQGTCCFELRPLEKNCSGDFILKIPAIPSGVYRICVTADAEPETHDCPAQTINQVACDVRIDNAKIATVQESDLQTQS